jgi:predicted ribosomally synthesized peptide with nif11-like leader
MSKQAFEDFIKKLQQDSNLYSELTSRFAGSEAEIAAADVAKFAAEKGYAFQVADISTELSEDQLSAVAGGLSTLSYKEYSPYSLGGTLYIKFDSLAYKF